MRERRPIVWACSGFLAMLLVLSFTGNGTLGAGIPVWLAVALAIAAGAVGLWSATRTSR